MTSSLQFRRRGDGRKLAAGNAVLVGARIREARRSRGWTLRQLAERCHGVTGAYLSRIENGQRLPALRSLAELGRAFGVTGLSLLQGDDRACPLCGCSADAARLKLEEIAEACESWVGDAVVHGQVVAAIGQNARGFLESELAEGLGAPDAPGV